MAELLCSCPRCLAQQGPVGDRHGVHKTKTPENSAQAGSLHGHFKHLLQPFLLALLNIGKQR